MIVYIIACDCCRTVVNGPNTIAVFLNSHSQPTATYLVHMIPVAGGFL